MRILFLGLAIAFMLSTPAFAMKEPWQYSNSYDNTLCELIMKDYQNEFGGYFVFIQPLNPDGSYELGDYAGHWLNRAYSKDRGIYYIDYWTQTYFNNTQQIQDLYYNGVQKRSVVYDFAERRPEFGLIWYY